MEPVWTWRLTQEQNAPPFPGQYFKKNCHVLLIATYICHNRFSKPANNAKQQLLYKFTSSSSPPVASAACIMEKMGSLCDSGLDAFSKWPKVFNLNSTSASQAIDKLCTIFATHRGSPVTLVSDSGVSFSSANLKFLDF